MKTIKVIMSVLSVSSLFLCGAAIADESKSQGIRYRKQQKINFEALLIEGQMKRPDLAIVTGNVSDGTDGLLKLREDFVDQVAIDAGESIK